MHQPSILSFFGTNTSKKNGNTDKENPEKGKSSSTLKLNVNDSVIRNLDEYKQVSKRKTLIESDSEGSDGQVETKDIKESFFGTNSSKTAATDKKKISKKEDQTRLLKRRQTLLSSNSDSNDSLENISKLSNNDPSPNIKKAKTELCESNLEDMKYITAISPPDYDPLKVEYHIIRDACWNAKQNVPYLALTRTFEVIETTTKRLEITKILSNFFRSVIYLSPNDLLPCLYLCINKVSPDYEGLEFGIGEKVIINALIQSTDTNKNIIESKMKVEGDLGQVAYNLPCTQKFLIQPVKLTVAAIFKKLRDIALMSGKSAQKNKVDMIRGLFNSCTKCERKYLVRSLLGKLRIRLAEQTVLAALGQAVTLTPPHEKKLDDRCQDIDATKPIIDRNTVLIKNAFCEHPNYDLLIKSIIEYGVESLPDHCSVSPGIPIKPMLAHPSKGVTEIFKRFDVADFTCEYKYDGERAQIHVFPDDSGNRKVQIFSRNQENTTTKYPDIVSLFQEMLDQRQIQSCILDSEAVAWDRETESILPFQVLSTRKRKDVAEDDIKIQVCIYVFDLIYFNGQSLVRQSLRERRQILRDNFCEKPGRIMMSTSLDSCKTDEISEFLELSIRDKCEGLMIKTLDKDASYEISKRSHNWLKLKKDYLDKIGDTVDLVVIGASYGTGKRASKYGSFLLACYDPESELYQSICRLGTGLTDEDLDKFYGELKEIVTKKPGFGYDVDKSFKPDCWFDPKYVWEIKAADLSISPDHRAAIGLVDKDKGISLRFPRFVRVREDKVPENATTSRQIAEMYRNQDVVKNNVPAASNPYEDDEFY